MKKFNVLDHNVIAGVDIDQTILLWDKPWVAGKNKLKIKYGSEHVYLTPHFYHVEIVKTWLDRGHYVIFWSSNGRAHALRAIKALGFKPHKNILVMDKMSKYLDDSTGHVTGARVFEPDFLKKDE